MKSGIGSAEVREPTSVKPAMQQECKIEIEIPRKKAARSAAAR
jgi:hypothetical protein